MPYDTQTTATALLRVQDRWDQGTYWTQLDARDALQVGLHVWQAATGAWTARRILTAVPHDPLVPIVGLEQVVSVRYMGLPLIRTTVEGLSHMRPSWRVDTPGAVGVPAQPLYWAPIGLTLVAIWPAPPNTGGLEADGLGGTPLLDLTVADTLPLDLPERAADAVCDLAAWWGAGKVGADEQDKHQPGLDAALTAAADQEADTDALALLRTWVHQLPALRAVPRAPAEAEA